MKIDRMADYIISTYFKQPSYWKIDGLPPDTTHKLRYLEAIKATFL